ncbi:hypothetical protein BDY24DRAFT_381285 [Mrakia frigida]|uniref:M28 family metallopeptidase n=1 Tax=Mrakia frigida TaxID=29902 RepID=UPI003FCBF4A2
MAPPVYTPLPQHQDVKAEVDAEQQINAGGEKKQQRRNLRKGIAIALASFVALRVGVASVVNSLGDGVGVSPSLPIEHNKGQGYLDALVDDGFALEPAYTLDPPLISPHSAIARASESLSAQGLDHGFPKPRFPISPKTAEGIFLGVPDEESCMQASRSYTGVEHRAGTGNDQLTALRVKQELESFFGIPTTGPYENVFDAGSPDSQNMVRGKHSEPKVWVDTYYPVMNNPVSREVSIFLPNSTTVQFQAKLREDIVEDDEFSIFRDDVPPFHGLSTSGNVTAEVVYVGYCRKNDFDLLASKGVSVKGKITLCKYGGVFRGLKVKASEDNGAIGTLIYSDPGDDGPITELAGYLPYPDGPARNPSSVQRGSVQYLSSYPGDPTTPGVPAYKNATRVEGGNFPKIPSLPISYEDALPLLRLLEGNGIKASKLGSSWEGGLTHKIDYYTGPSKQLVRLVNQVDTRVIPIWNTMAIIPGYLSDEVVAIGNHRDAWILGASDPSSGTAVTHEVYKGLGALLKKGWKPLRTILIASWDAEEYGLIGSTEFAEDFADWIPENVVTYFNLDSTGAGSTFGASASPSLALLMKSTSEEILHPTEEGRSAWSARLDGGDWKSHQEFGIAQIEDDFEALFSSGTGIPSLGSGSDFTPFLQHLGVASIDGPGFSNGPQDPVYHYHSIYDSQYWMEQFGDAGFHRHVTAAKILGLVLLRMSDSLVIPLNITQYASELSDYRDKVAHIHSSLNFDNDLDLDTLSSAIAKVQKATAALDVKKAKLIEKLRDLTSSKCNKHGLKSLGRHARRAFDTVIGRPHTARFPFPSPHKLKKIKEVLAEIKVVNGKLAGFEAGFLDPEGLPGREWYKHKIVAPGRWLGYGTTTFPEVTEALTLDGDVKAAQIASENVVLLLEAMAERLSV